MKKLFYLFLIPLLTLMSCSNDDDSIKENPAEIPSRYEGVLTQNGNFVTDSYWIVLSPGDNSYVFTTNIPHNYGAAGSEFIFRAEGKYKKVGTKLTLEDKALVTTIIRNSQGGASQTSPTTISDLERLFPTSYNINNSAIESDTHKTGFKVKGTQK